MSTHTADNFLKFINWGWFLFNAFKLFIALTVEQHNLNAVGGELL